MKYLVDIIDSKAFEYTWVGLLLLHIVFSLYNAMVLFTWEAIAAVSVMVALLFLTALMVIVAGKDIDQ